MAPGLDAVARRSVDAPAATGAARFTVVMLTGAGAGLVGLRGGPLLAAELWLLALVVVLSITDLTTRRLPNVLLGPGGAVLAALLATGALSEGRAGDVVGALLGAGVLFLIFLLVAVAAPGGLGMGDVKLVGVLGLVLGLTGLDAVLAALVLAVLLHAAGSVTLLLARRVGRRTPLPLGPALLLGTVAGLGWFSPLLG
ncbi:MAG: prepilin peptidase [Mycobacteriaceae bacterium]